MVEIWSLYYLGMDILNFNIRVYRHW